MTAGWQNGRRAGGILIVVLWTLFLLAALAMATAAYVGGQMEEARRLGGRVLARQAARAGIEHGIAALLRETNAWESLQEDWANDPAAFKDVDGGSGMRWTAWYVYDCADGSVATNYGFTDEQGRVDVNYAREELLTTLLRITGGLSAGEAKTLAGTILQARVPAPAGGRDIVPGRGVWTVAGIENGPFRSVHELLWVRGMSREVFERVAPHITVHGATRININTAGPEILRVLASVRGGEGGGEWARKMLQSREQGGTFRTLSPAGIADTLGGKTVLTPDDLAVLGGILPFITVTSDRFRGYVTAGDGGGRGAVRITCVWDRRERRFLYWNED